MPCRWKGKVASNSDFDYKYFSLKLTLIHIACIFDAPTDSPNFLIQHLWCTYEP